MRTVIKRSAMLAAVFMLLPGRPASAQEAIMKVPFPFVVHNQTLPPGEYQVRPLGWDPSILMIRTRYGSHPSSAIVMTRRAEGQDLVGDQPALTFKRDEQHYRLATIWESRTDGREVPK